MQPFFGLVSWTSFAPSTIISNAILHISVCDVSEVLAGGKILVGGGQGNELPHPHHQGGVARGQEAGLLLLECLPNPHLHHSSLLLWICNPKPPAQLQNRHVEHPFTLLGNNKTLLQLRHTLLSFLLVVNIPVVRLPVILRKLVLRKNNEIEPNMLFGKVRTKMKDSNPSHPNDRFKRYNLVFLFMLNF